MDTTVPEQTYYEDCEVCCRPILVRYHMQGGRLVGFSAERAS